MAEFCAGYCSTGTAQSWNVQKRRQRRLLGQPCCTNLCIFSPVYRWSSCLDYHSACLIEIEKGNSKWGDNFQHLIHTTLVAQGAEKAKRKEKRRKGDSKGGAVRFCSPWQKGYTLHITHYNISARDAGFKKRNLVRIRSPSVQKGILLDYPSSIL